MSINDDTGDPVRGEIVLTKNTPRHVMVTAQKDRIEFSTLDKAPTFQ